MMTAVGWSTAKLLQAPKTLTPPYQLAHLDSEDVIFF